MRARGQKAGIAVLALVASGMAASVGVSSSQLPAMRWLSRQLQRPVSDREIVSAPPLASLDDCWMRKAWVATTGATAVSLRCNSQTLPQLLLVTVPVAELNPTATAEQSEEQQHLQGGSASAGQKTNGPPRAAPNNRASKLVHPGTHLQANWRMQDLRARLTVVALDGGEVGDEIRVRIVAGQRVLRARIVDAHTVNIVGEGA